MRIKKSYLIELDHETKNTSRILERIPDDKLDWRPHNKSMSLDELASHVVGLHNWEHQAIPKDVFDQTYKKRESNLIPFFYMLDGLII